MFRLAHLISSGSIPRGLQRTFSEVLASYTADWGGVVDLSATENAQHLTLQNAIRRAFWT